MNFLQKYAPVVFEIHNALGFFLKMPAQDQKDVNSTLKFKVSTKSQANIVSILNGEIDEMDVKPEEAREAATADGYCVECAGFFY
jgi:hypothetical protein